MEHVKRFFNIFSTIYVPLLIAYAFSNIMPIPVNISNHGLFMAYVFSSIAVLSAYVSTTFFHVPGIKNPRWIELIDRKIDIVQDQFIFIFVIYILLPMVFPTIGLPPIYEFCMLFYSILYCLVKLARLQKLKSDLEKKVLDEQNKRDIK